MQNIWGYLLTAGEGVTLTSKYIVSRVEIFIVVWLLLLMFFIYYEVRKKEIKSKKNLTQHK